MRNVILIGDALRTVHFSIGSGTRLAFEDAIALDRAFAETGDDVARALDVFERERRPVVEKIIAAANASSYWYERLPEKMKLQPWELAYDYMKRSGRMTDERLRELSPKFMARVDRERAAKGTSREAKGASLETSAEMSRFPHCAHHSLPTRPAPFVH